MSLYGRKREYLCLFKKCCLSQSCNKSPSVQRGVVREFGHEENNDKVEMT
jgi:hypothetical protein